MLRAPLRTALVAPLLFTTSALAHDIWINRGHYRSPAGEWCCGAEDCGIVAANAVTAAKGGYSLRGDVTYGEAATGNAEDGPTRHGQVNETVPYNQALPSPDGSYWLCQRSDGSPRCFFAPKPDM